MTVLKLTDKIKQCDKEDLDVLLNDINHLIAQSVLIRNKIKALQGRSNALCEEPNNPTRSPLNNK